MEPNWKNRTLWTGDNLDVMRGMNKESVDLIYLDPPFNSNRNYAAPIGSEAAGAAFKDMWTLNDVDEAWHGEIAEREPGVYAAVDAAGITHGKGMKSYLVMMAVRLLEMRRVLKPTGSIYLHCDPTANAYLHLLMDAIFGKDNFRSEITWKRSSAHSDAKQGRQQHGRIHDVLLFYTKTDEWTWNQEYTPYSQEHINKFYRHVEEKTGRRFALDNLTGPGGATKGNPSYEVMGVTRYWRYSQKRMQELINEGRVVQRKPGGVPCYKRYLDEMPGISLQDIWLDINPLSAQAKERTGYPTQKPLALLERIIKASSNKGDVILDPFCGCATALVAAESLDRQWVGIDLSSKAVELVLLRLDKLLGSLFRPNMVTPRTDVPKRTNEGPLPDYRTHKHTLYGRQEGACNGCQTHFQFRNLTIDHVLPQAKGGSDHPDNLQLLCGACNSTKGTGTQEQLIAKLKRQNVLLNG